MIGLALHLDCRIAPCFDRPSIFSLNAMPDLPKAVSELCELAHLFFFLHPASDVLAPRYGERYACVARDRVSHAPVCVCVCACVLQSAHEHIKTRRKASAGGPPRNRAASEDAKQSCIRIPFWKAVSRDMASAQEAACTSPACLGERTRRATMSK